MTNHDGGHDHGDHRSADEDHDHGHHARDVDTVGFGLLTVSTSRTLEDDATGDALEESIDAAGHVVATRNLVTDEAAPIRAAVEAMVEDDSVECVVTNGGTGLTPDDVTVEAVAPLVDRRIPGFGELFRYRSYEDVGVLAMFSRATAGVADGVPVFCLPGSTDGATLAVEELILPVAGHLVAIAGRETE